MSNTTPLLPLELAPFSLHSLLSPVFTTHSTPAAPDSPSKLPTSPTAPAPLGRLGQLVANVGSGMAGAPGAGPAGDAIALASVRSVEASGEKVWVGASDGRVRIYEVVPPSVDPQARAALAGEHIRSPSAASSNQSSPGLRGEAAALDLAKEVVVTMGKKAADRIALMERLGKAVILSEGILTFHSLPSLVPLPVQSFPAMKGVTTFSLDEDELAGGGLPEAMHVCAIKRRTVHLLRVTMGGVTHVKELPLRGGALLSVFRRGRACIADTANYSIIDLDAAIALPLLPISQTPNTEPRPLSTSSTAATPSTGPDPRQRPAIACIGKDEFLLASHTGSTTLGVFVNESGEPCRGTLEWGSNLRSLTVDPPYVIGLLYNNTIEIHSIHTQEIVQLIQLPLSSSPLSFDPRTLLRSWSGLEVLGATGAHKIEPMTVALLLRPFGRSNLSPEPPKTPTKRIRSSPSKDGLSVTDKTKGTRARTLLVGKNSLHVLAPLTLVAQADALMEKGRFEEAVKLAGNVEASGSANPEVTYVYLRAAYVSLSKTLFQDAFDLFLRSSCDPRLVVRMFPDLRDPLITSDEEITICSGNQVDVVANMSVDDYILANLNHNYAPHIMPDVESGSPTVELRAMLMTTARDCARVYLQKWREARRVGGGGSAGDSRKVDMVVDTTLVRLLAEEGLQDEIVRILDGPNDCVLQQVESSLLEAGLYHLLSTLLLKNGEVSKTLDIWTKLVEGVYMDEGFRGGIKKISDLLWKSKDTRQVEKYGIWLLQRDRVLGLKLFTDPRQSLHFDTRDLFGKVRAVDAEAADLLLESIVLQKRDPDSGLHADLVKRYINRLGELLTNPDTKTHVRKLESDYSDLVASTSNTPLTFLAFLLSRFSTDSQHATFDRVRLKAILFLGTSSNYDVLAIKQELEEMERKGLGGLTIERSIIYGKLRLDRLALSLLLHSLEDLTSSETYVHQSGDPLSHLDISTTASLLSLPTPKLKKVSQAKKEAEEGRKAILARLLVEMCLVGRSSEIEGGGKRSKEQVARILETQAIHLDTLEILPLIPSTWPLSLITPFLARSLRRSLHQRQESSLLKGLALSQNLVVAESLGNLQIRLGPTIQRTGTLPKEPEVVERPIPMGEKEKGYEMVQETDELDLR